MTTTTAENRPSPGAGDAEVPRERADGIEGNVSRAVFGTVGTARPAVGSSASYHGAPRVMDHRRG
jgi:hypothetical protein